MRFLNLDLDYFLDGVKYFPENDIERLDSSEYKPWTELDVKNFLENQCGLSLTQPIPGRIVEHHDGAFDFWEELIGKTQLDIPFEVVHIDGHSDLGFGDQGYWYLMSELLHISPPDRAKLIDRRQVEFGNYLAFAIACRWVSKLTFVKHPDAGDDLLYQYFKDDDSKTGVIKMKIIEKQFFASPSATIRNLPVPLSYEPEVLYFEVDGRTFKENEPFDFVLLSRSPGFTPLESDRLIPIIGQYIEII